jgi:hypothetical protein
MTNLPASDESFVNCKTEQTLPLSDVLSGEGTSTLSSFAGVVLLACLFGRNLHHLHRASANDRDHDLNGEFWKRHRHLDNILLNTSLSLPSHLRLPEGINDANIVFCNMCIHTSTICLHQAAIFKAEKNSMPSQIAAEGKRRCIIAADQITNIMKMICHMDLTIVSLQHPIFGSQIITDVTQMNPFMAFCLYVACRVFVQYLKSRPDDPTVRSSLQFLLSAMNALKSKQPLTETFLVQLDVELEGSGLEDLNGVSRFAYGMHKSPIIVEGRDCVNDCVNVLLPRHGQSHESSQNDRTPGSTSGSSYAPPNFPCSTSLPSRQKTFAQPPPASSYQHFDNNNNNKTHLSGARTSTAFSSPATDDDRIHSLAVDMDVSTDASNASDRHHSSSDHPTPSTHKTSSRSSFSPPNMDHPSPPKPLHQQVHSLPNNLYTSTSSAPIMQSVTMSQSTAAYFTASNSSNSSNSNTSAFAAYFQTGTDTLADPEVVENPFNMPSGWEFSVGQSSGASAGPSAGAESAISPYDEVSWAQTPDIPGWSSWRS